MSQAQVINISQQTLMLIVTVSAPPLILGLAVGIIVSLFQTITSIQEPTLSFVPKILAVFAALMIFGAWMLTKLQTYVVDLFSQMSNFLQ